MANKKGRKFIPVFENQLYSTLLFTIIAGNNYPKKIAESLNKDFGNVSRQLKFLEKKDFVSVKIEGNKKIFPFEKKIYSVNWNKILDEFIKLLKEQKDEFIEIHKNLKTNIKPERLELLEMLENQGFINNLKKNKYLIYSLKIYFSAITKIKRCSLYNALGYFTFFGDFEFTTLTHPSIRQVISQMDLKKDLEKLEKKKDSYPSFPPKAEENTKEWYDEFRASHDKMMKDMSSRFEGEEKKIQGVINKDMDLRIILKFNEIRRNLSMDLGLQIALNDATEQTAFYVINNNFSKEEIKKYCDEIFFPYSLRYKGVSENLKQEVKEKIENMNENDTNAPKPNEIKHKERIKR